VLQPLFHSINDKDLQQNTFTSYHNVQIQTPEAPPFAMQEIYYSL
jgi:hypothetical protein